MAKTIEFVKSIEKLIIGKKDQKKQIRNSYQKYAHIEVNEDDIITKVSANYEYLEEHKKHCGYFWIVSSDDYSLSEILNMYRHRDVVEKGFKYSKSEMDLNKLYTTSNESLESKTFLSFIGTVYRTYINKNCESYLFQYSSETSQTILLELNKIKVERNNGKYVLKYALTSRQNQILSCFKMSKKDIFKAIEQLNIVDSLRN